MSRRFLVLGLRPTTLAQLQIADRTGDVVDLAIAEAGLLTRRNGPRLRKDVQPLGRWRWAWRVIDEAVSPHRILAECRRPALTRDAAYRRAHRAYCRILHGPAVGFEVELPDGDRVNVVPSELHDSSAEAS